VKTFDLPLDAERHRTLRLTAARADTTNRAVLHALIDIISEGDDLACAVVDAVNERTAGRALEGQRGRPKSGDSPTTARSQRVLLIRRDGGECQGCGIEGDNLPLDEVFHVDHKQPVARGGSEALQNKQLLCRKCNLRKGSMSWDEWQDEIKAGRMTQLLLEVVE